MIKYLLILLTIAPALQASVAVNEEKIVYKAYSKTEKELLEKIHKLERHNGSVHSRLLKLCGQNNFNKFISSSHNDNNKEEELTVLEEEGLVDIEGKPKETVCTFAKIYDDLMRRFKKEFKEAKKEFVVEEGFNI